MADDRESNDLWLDENDVPLTLSHAAYNFQQITLEFINSMWVLLEEFHTSKTMHNTHAEKLLGGAFKDFLERLRALDWVVDPFLRESSYNNLKKRREELVFVMIDRLKTLIQEGH